MGVGIGVFFGVGADMGRLSQIGRLWMYRIHPYDPFPAFGIAIFTSRSASDVKRLGEKSLGSVC